MPRLFGSRYKTYMHPNQFPCFHVEILETIPNRGVNNTSQMFEEKEGGDMADTGTDRLYEFSLPVADFFKKHVSHLGITHTFHKRIFNNGTAYILGNNIELMKHYIESNYALPEPGTYKKSQTINVWSADMALLHYNDMVLDMKKYFNVDHQVSLYFHYDDYLDILELGTTPDRPEMINYYINNYEKLKRFFLKYKSKFESVLTHLDLHTLEFPLRPKNFTKRYETNSKFSQLTRREFECLEELVKGQTAKMIATSLNISPRTVDRHVENIRDKLELKYRIEIVTEFLEYKKYTTHTK